MNEQPKVPKTLTGFGPPGRSDGRRKSLLLQLQPPDLIAASVPSAARNFGSSITLAERDNLTVKSLPGYKSHVCRFCPDLDQ